MFRGSTRQNQKRYFGSSSFITSIANGQNPDTPFLIHNGKVVDISSYIQEQINKLKEQNPGLSNEVLLELITKNTEDLKLLEAYVYSTT